MNLRNWLIVLSVLIILGVLVDAYRRLKKSRDLAKMMNLYAGEDDPKDFNPELPGGGARVSPRCEPDFELMDMPELSAVDENHFDPQPDLSLQNSPAMSAFSSQESTLSSQGSQEKIVERKNDANQAPLVDDSLKGEQNTLVKDKPTYSQTRRLKRKGREEKSTQGKKPSKPSSELIVVNVVAPKQRPYVGCELLQNLLSSGFKYGEMGIFHRHEGEQGQGDILFSVANGVEPGTFNLDTMTEAQIPAISFFMSLPGPKNPVKAFELLLQIINHLLDELGGELRDENHSTMRKQTLEHCRQRLIEFERRQLARH